MVDAGLLRVAALNTLCECPKHVVGFPVINDKLQICRTVFLIRYPGFQHQVGIRRIAYDLELTGVFERGIKVIVDPVRFATDLSTHVLSIRANIGDEYLFGRQDGLGYWAGLGRDGGLLGEGGDRREKGGGEDGETETKT
jgi:hypothetical protein